MTSTTGTATCDRCHSEHEYYNVTVQRDGEALCYRCVMSHDQIVELAKR